MKGKKKVVAAFLAGIITGALGLWIGYNGIFGSVVVPTSEYDAKADAYDHFSKASSLYNHIRQYYYKDVDTETLVDGMYRGMVSALDDKYSEYMTKDEYEAWRQQFSGEFTGVGITMGLNEDGKVQVMDLVEGSPASKSEIKVGDIITKVDGKSYDDFSDLAKAVRGEAGTKVEITYIHDGKEQKATLTRAVIALPSVGSRMLDDNIGYIQIGSFSKDTSDEFKEELKKIEEEGAKAFIIDLRNNGGGLVSESLKIADALLGKCVVVNYVDRDGNKTSSESDAAKTALPYVILVNGNTASASEILSAAVQDNEGGRIIGTTTYGKGVIQSSSRLSDGSVIKLTVKEYLSPDGHTINGKGIRPDDVVELKSGDAKDYQLEKALEVLGQ